MEAPVARLVSETTLPEALPVAGAAPSFAKAVARAEAMRRKDPAEYELRKAESYVVGEGNPNPSVVTFTTELACMGANELIHRLQGFRGPDGAAANRVRKFHLNEDRRPGHKPGSACPV